ncbi:sulfotransferase family 2 domain-containing protein [Alphaproteobacteria bacterium]|nr:sulfotransferase family 2 domain-containing protein [Alphaproteobacteria bacterium]
MSTYAIFHNKLTKKKLIYYPCPKNANTSTKMFLAKHCNVERDYLFLGDEIPQKNQTAAHYGKKKNIIKLIPSKQPFEKKNVDIKCCIVRDPIKRFLSAYKNRIMYHGDPQFNNHTIDMVLDKLESKNFENKHFLPQTYFLGDDLDYYTFWTKTDNINIFVEQVNEFFGKKIEFPKIQTGGHDIKIGLNSSQIERVEKIYINDYNLINK